MKLTHAVVASLLAIAAGQALACYTVYDRSGRVTYNGSEPPVDMSRPLNETLAARFPGSHMVFDSQASCDAIAPLGAISAPRGGAPLLTDRRTAQAMNVPYTVMQGSIVMVQPRNARVAPGVTVVPAGAFDTTSPGPGTVITELRNPPLTIVQSGERVIMSELSR
jgi:hypothetical protein